MAVTREWTDDEGNVHTLHELDVMEAAHRFADEYLHTAAVPAFLRTFGELWRTLGRGEAVPPRHRGDFLGVAASCSECFERYADKYECTNSYDCAAAAREHFANEISRDYIDGTIEFSRSECDRCGSTLAGVRHVAHQAYVGDGAEAFVPDHMEICSECAEEIAG